MILWTTAPKLVDYPDAIEHMTKRIEALKTGPADEEVWLLEHPPLYTAGTSAKPQDLLDAQGFPVYGTGRGGQFTYHGPGQRVAYVMIDLNRRERDLRKYVYALEKWIIDTLEEFGVLGQRREGRIGIWVEVPSTNGQEIQEEKIAAIGVRISKWITYHGIAINLNPNLEHFAGIVPCGLPQFGVTSLHKLGVMVTMTELDAVLKRYWERNEFLRG
jgi:lipoyl(octanoyl) transferase